MKKGTRIVAALLLLVLILMVAEWNEMSLLNKQITKTFEMTEQKVSSPLTGFAPDARNQSNELEHELVYVDVTFRELWPEKDRFDFLTIEQENHLSYWRAAGKHVVFRFISDYPMPDEHMDIPDWLYEETGGDGDFYDHAYGKGYSPNYSNPTFIAYHAEAIKELGERYGKDSFFSYVQLGSLGHWGEWHTYLEGGVRPLPKADLRRQYVLPYVDAFPLAKLVMRRPFEIAEEWDMGVYNDMAGHPQATKEWLDWMENGGVYQQTGEEALVPMEDAWKTAPIGGEFTSDIPMGTMLGVNQAQTVQLIRDSHTTFLGPNIPAVEAEAISRVMGYRIGITKFSLVQPFMGHSTKVKIEFENNGVAPMYWNWPVSLYGYDKNQELLFEVPLYVQLTKILPGKKIKTVTELPRHVLLDEAASLYIGIEDPMTQQPAVPLVSNQERNDYLYLLYEWE
ncbi:DUF4832 domain-containing protein [Jeotgalibaca caeni]|uniref:DUF4832 domain-containing protein n=1 Tax=Jeotgalibaca caeni TaxID=3028623 RepID=UPI00237DF6FD|nr:DUF4832 domain-containing protein [Jeotgalibaca caeni]MDE1548246.1 DUF4832 domain-containing protein [Jeotgalibaca caeni]